MSEATEVQIAELAAVVAAQAELTRDNQPTTNK
ncbi:hypothetical protein JDBV04_00230 [Mycobacterium phage mushipu]|nr:hypothetical protein JDBV04_00230 [Mycobacterium phage mushipu]